MADSYVTQTGDGTEGPFSFSALDYLSVDHLVIKVDGTEKTLTTHYTISGTDVTFTSGNFPAADAVIKIQRDTPRTKATRVVDFADGAVLTEADLDNAHLQNLYIAQESFETSGAVLIYDDSLAAYTADSKEIKVLADPTTDASAVNRKYVTDVASFGVPGVPQQFNTTITDASTQFTLTDWDGVSQNMIVVALDGVVQIPGTDFSVAADGTDTVLTLVGITPPNPTILNVQNFGVAKSSSTLSANSVTTATIVDTAVTTAKLGDDSVTTDKLANLAVSSAKVQDDTVDFARLKDTDFIPGTLANAQPLMIATDGDLSYRNLVVADVTDFNSTLNARAISGFGAATGNVIMGDGSTNYKITNLDAPTSAMDAARKAYVDDNASVGMTPTVTGTLTDQNVYNDYGSSSPQTVDVATATLPSDCARPLMVFVDFDATSVSESGMSVAENCDLKMAVEAFDSSDTLTGVSYGWTVSSVTNGVIDSATSSNITGVGFYAPATTTYIKARIYTDGGTANLENADRFIITATLKLQVSYTRVA